jgi:CubicO group peptidase (beta-lactamase class C family)
MKKLSRVAAILVASASIVNGDHVDDVITAQMKERQIPGVALAVIQDGKIVREQGYGFGDEAHQEPITPATLFQAASVSKPVAALGALHLVEQGQLSLDDNVNAALRSWRIPDNRFTRTHPVTLRLILSHSAGLTIHGFPGYRVGSPVPSLLQILDGRPPANAPPVRVDQIPGSKWRYSGGGYLVMQQMMIDVTGQSFADYMHDAVLGPLGMSSSTFAQPLPESLASRAATGFVGAPRRALEGRWRIKPELAAGGLWTTAGDLARFLLGIQRSLAGTSNLVISQSMTRQMLTKQKEDSGLGFFLGGDPPRFGHNGSNPGFDAVTVALCDTGEGAVILMNGNTDIEVLKNILVEAIADQYRWPGYPKTRPMPNQTMQPTPPLVMHPRTNAGFCFKWRGALSLSR